MRNNPFPETQYASFLVHQYPMNSFIVATPVSGYIADYINTLPYPRFKFIVSGLRNLC